MLRQLAEKLKAPVAVARRVKGALREDHPLALRDINVFLTRQAVKLADCTVAIGIRFTFLDTRSWTLELHRPLIQIDEDASQIGREYPCDIGVVGDLKLTLQALIEEVQERRGTWTPSLERLRDGFASQPHVPLLADIREVLPADGILSVDVHAIGYATLLN